MSKTSYIPAFLKKFSIFVAIFIAIFFVSGVTGVKAETLDPVRQDISYTISGDNVFGYYNVKTSGDKVFNWNVDVTHRGPGPMHVVTMGFWDETAGSAATIKHAFSVPSSGKVDYKNPVESGSFNFSYDTRYRSCGRVQIDGSFIDERYSYYNDTFLFHAIIIDYGVDCPDVPPPTPTPVCTENASVTVTNPLPSVMVPGQTYTFTMKSTNSGDTRWYHGSYFQFVKTSGNLTISPSYGHVGNIYPGDNDSWTFSLVAPSTPGNYSVGLQMVHRPGADYLKADGTTCTAPSIDTYFGNTGVVTSSVATPTHTLTINKIGNGAGVVTGAGSYNYGTIVTATAVASVGSAFTGWGGDCDASGHVTMNGDKTCTATFTLNTYTITASSEANGTVMPPGVTTKNFGTSQVYTITADTNYHIKDVLVDGSSVGAINTYTFSNIAANHTISASFAIDQVTLTINKAGTGTGTVSGAGTYDYGSTVTAYATASAGSTFTGWSGDCDANGHVTMNGNKICTANFNLVSAIGVDLSANPTSMTLPANSTVLTWTTIGGPTSCTATGSWNSWNGAKNINGGFENIVGLSAGVHTFTIRCSKPGTADVSSTVSVTVLNTPPTVTLTANPTNVIYGGSSTLTWVSTNATSCIASGDWSGSKAIPGNNIPSTELQNNLTTNKNYIITCYGLGGSDVATTTVTVGAQQVANLSVLKTSDKSTANVGDTVTYTIALANNGPDNATGVIVTDILNTGLNFVSATSSVGTYATTTGIWTVGNLNNGSIATLTLVTTIKAGYQGQTIPNTATTTATQTDPTPGNNTSTVTVVVNGPAETADLSVVKTANKTTANIGDTITYTISLVNNGPNSATNVTVTDILDSRLNFVSATTSQGSYATSTGIWTVGTLVGSDGLGGVLTKTLTIVATIKDNAQGQTIPNTATTTATQTDPTPGNNTSTVTVVVNGPTPIANLSVLKTSDKSTANVGDTVTYTIALANNGPDNATGVIVTDILNTGLNFVSATSSVGTYATTTGIWTVGNLNNGSIATLTLVTTIKAGYQGQTIPNTATTTATQTDPTPGNNTSTVTVVVNGPVNHPPVITLVGANPATVIVGRTYTDPGATALDQEDGDITLNIVATSTVNTSIVGTYTVTYNVSDSQGLAAVPVSRTVNVINDTQPVTGKITFCLVLADQNNVIATSSNGLPAGMFSLNLATTTDLNNTTLYTKNWVTTTFSPNKRLILNTGYDADCVTYDNLPLGTYYYSQLSVNGALWLVPQYNDQNTQSINNIFDFFPYSSELFNATTTDDINRNLNSDGQIIVTSGNRDQTLVVLEKDGPAQCTIPPQITSSLTATASVGQPFSYTITASSTTATTFSVSGLPAGLSFSTTTNMITGTPTTAGTFNITLNAVNQCVGGVDVKILVLTITTNPVVNLSVTKTADKTSVNTGDSLTYTITLTNSGPYNATGVKVTDVLHAGLDLVSATYSLGSYATSTGIWTVGNLNNASSTTLVLVTSIKSGYQGQTIPNTAIATSTEPDSTSGDNTSTVNVTVNTPYNPPNPPPSCKSHCGGGPIYPNNLTIFNEQVVETVPGVAFVTWNTNLEATRRVVYGNTSNPVIGNGPNYGYTSSTELIPLPLLTAHGMAIGVQPGVTYYFREISTDTINGVTRTAIGKELVLNPGNVPTSCYYLYDYLRKDFNNNPVEVRKLQVFLRDLEGFTNLQITGIYDDQTIAALDSFQNRYAGDILTPWGHTAPTSYTYILTKKKVNEIYCKRAFPVTPLQQTEIDSYRVFLLGLQSAGITLPTPIIPNTNTGTTTPSVLLNDVVGFGSTTNVIGTASTSENTTLAGVSTTTRNIVSKFTANILFAWDKVGAWAGLSCSSELGSSCFCRLINWVLLIIIGVVSFLWYREYKQNKDLDVINKEIDLN